MHKGVPPPTLPPAGNVVNFNEKTGITRRAIKRALDCPMKPKLNEAFK